MRRWQRWTGVVLFVGVFLGLFAARVARAENLTTVSVELSSARFATASDFTVRFTTVSAVTDGMFQIFVPAATNNSTDGQADVGGWDFGSNVTVTCPDDVSLDGHIYDFSPGTSAPAAVLRAGRMYHLFTCRYTGPGRAGSVFNDTIFGAIKISSLLNPNPLPEHQAGIADTYSILIEHADSSGTRVDGSFAEVAIVEAVQVEVATISGVRVSVTVPERSPTPTPLPTVPPTPVPLPTVPPSLLGGLGLAGLLGYVFLLFFLTGNPIGFLLAFLISLLQFWLLPWPGKKHELREQEGKRAIPWAGFFLTWLDDKKRSHSKRVMTNLLGQWDTRMVAEVMYQVALSSQSFQYPADKVSSSERRPEKGERQLYVVGESIWLFDRKKKPQITTIQFFAIPLDIAFHFVVWVKRWRPGRARWQLFLPRLFLLVALAASAGLAFFSPQWWTILLLVWVVYVLLRDIFAHVPRQLEVYTA